MYDKTAEIQKKFKYFKIIKILRLIIFKRIHIFLHL